MSTIQATLTRTKGVSRCVDRLLLVTENTVFRLGFEQLNAIDNSVVEVVPIVPAVLVGGEASTFSLVVVDGELADEGGLGACMAVRACSSELPLLLISSQLDDNFVRRAVGAGISGLMGKDTKPEELRSAIGWLIKGHSVLDPRVTRAVIGWALIANIDPDKQDLSARELEVLRLVGRGESNKRIARRLGLTESSVKTYLRRIFDKLGCRTRAAAAAAMARKGLL